MAEEKGLRIQKNRPALVVQVLGAFNLALLLEIVTEEITNNLML
jgi:hypothetical protein